MPTGSSISWISYVCSASAALADIGAAGSEPTKRAKWTHDQLRTGWACISLMGTVKYPAQATPRRSSLSRVRENCTHGLKGDVMETGRRKLIPR